MRKTGQTTVRWLTLLLGTLICMSQLDAFGQASSHAPKSTTSTPPVQGKVEAASFDLDDNKGYVVSFRYDAPDRPLIIVQATINNSKPYSFAVDTGTNTPIVISTWAQKEIKLPLAGKTPPAGSGNSTAQYTEGCQIFVRGKSDGAGLPFHVDNAVVCDLPVLDNWFHPRLAGIIGASIFKAITSRFDFDKHTITFFTFKHPPLNPSGPHSNIPLLPPSESGKPLQIAVPLPGLGTVPFGLVTAQSDTILFSPRDDKLERLATHTGDSHFDENGTYPASTVLLPEMRFGTVKVPLVSLTVVTHTDASSIGMDLLSCFRVTIDPDNNILTLEPRKGFQYRRTGLTGIELAEQSGKYTINIINSLDAASTKIAMNDRVLSIDGEVMADMTHIQARARLSGYEGTAARIVLEQAGGKQTVVELPRHSIYSNVVAGILGMTLLKNSECPANVLEVLPGSQAERSGIHADDEILAVDGKPITGKTADQLRTDLTGDSAKSIRTLEIKRKADGSIVTLQLGRAGVH